MDDMGVTPEPFRVGEVVAWWEPDLPLVRLLSVDMAAGDFTGEFLNQPGKRLAQDLDSICHRTPAYEAWRAVLLAKFAALHVESGDASAAARRLAWREATQEKPDLWKAVKREHPILGSRDIYRR